MTDPLCRVSQEEIRNDERYSKESQADIEARQERKEFVDNIMSGDDQNQFIPEVLGNNDDCIDRAVKIAIANCDKPFEELTLREISYLAKQAYELNRSMANALENYA